MFHSTPLTKPEVYSFDIGVGSYLDFGFLHTFVLVLVRLFFDGNRLWLWFRFGLGLLGRLRLRRRNFNTDFLKQLKQLVEPCFGLQAVLLSHPCLVKFSLFGSGFLHILHLGWGLALLRGFHALIVCVTHFCLHKNIFWDKSTMDPPENFMTPEDLKYLPPKMFAPKPQMLDFPIPFSFPPKQ